MPIQIKMILSYSFALALYVVIFWIMPWTWKETRTPDRFFMVLIMHVLLIISTIVSLLFGFAVYAFFKTYFISFL